MKEILLALLREIEDLRANERVLAANAGKKVSVAEAQNAKFNALELMRGEYEELRKRIESLPD